MENIVLNNNVNINGYLNIIDTKSCLYCGSCVGCIIFAPIVGAFLAAGLAINVA